MRLSQNTEKKDANETRLWREIIEKMRVQFGIVFMLVCLSESGGDTSPD